MSNLFEHEARPRLPASPLGEICDSPAKRSTRQPATAWTACIKAPSPVDKSAFTPSNGELVQDIKTYLDKGDVSFELQLQFFVDEKTTPVEDASVDWLESISPYVTVAKLTIPKQDIESEEGKEISETTEKDFFDPWNALLEHRPLGDVMRARKYIYYASQKERGANK